MAMTTKYIVSHDQDKKKCVLYMTKYGTYNVQYMYIINLWSYNGSWIYNYMYLCNQYLSPMMLWVRISIRARCDEVCQCLATGRWFSPGAPVSSTNKTDGHDITEIFLKVVLNTIKQTYIINQYVCFTIYRQQLLKRRNICTRFLL